MSGQIKYIEVENISSLGRRLMLVGADHVDVSAKESVVKSMGVGVIIISDVEFRALDLSAIGDKVYLVYDPRHFKLNELSDKVKDESSNVKSKVLKKVKK